MRKESLTRRFVGFARVTWLRGRAAGDLHAAEMRLAETAVLFGFGAVGSLWPWTVLSTLCTLSLW